MTDVPRPDAVDPGSGGVARPARSGRFLVDQTRTLLNTARRSVRPDGGFWWLTDDRTPDRGEPVHTWITCRMTHVAALAHRNGDPDAAALVDHGVAALSTLLRDERYGGWFGAVDQQGVPVNDRKAGVRPRVRTARRLQRRARRTARRTGCSPTCSAVVRDRFWDDDAGAVRESWNRDWTVTEDYRGANSSMHMVEAFLAAAAATGDASWADRALRIANHLVHGAAAQARLAAARALHHRLDAAARLQPGPARRPVPAVRLHHRALAGVGPAAAGVGGGPAATTPLAARRRPCPVRRRRARGWAVDGADGFVYTIDWDDRPVVRSRMHWVSPRPSVRRSPCTAAPGTRSTSTGIGSSGAYARRSLIDQTGWRHEWTRRTCRPTRSGAAGPDVYHAYQAVLLSRAADGLGGPGPLAPGEVAA